MPDEAAIQAQPTVVVSAVLSKLPDFWPSDPELWFAQAEALFAAQNITQEKTKFGHVVRVLPAEYASEIHDIILRPREAPPSSTENRSSKPCLPFKTTTFTADSTRGRPW